MSRRFAGWGMRREGGRDLGESVSRRAAAGFTGPLFAWEDGTFTRDSIATYQTSDTALAIATTNELRMRDFDDGVGAIALFEGSRTNKNPYANAINSWNAGAGVTITANSATSPDGTSNADKMAMAGTSSFSNYLQIPVTSGKAYTSSLWIQAFDGGNVGKTFRFGHKSNATVLCKVTGTLTAGWARFESFMNAATASVDTFPVYDSRANEPQNLDAALPAYTANVFGYQLEEGAFPSSLIYTTGSAASRSPDVFLLADDAYPDVLLSGAWTIPALRTKWASSRVFTDTFVLISLGDGSDALYFYSDGGNTYLEVAAANDVKVTSSALVFSAAQPLVISVDAAAGTLSVSGATSGNGISAGTPWAWTRAAARVGGLIGTNGLEAFAHIAIPEAA